jgi:hypothetical protein
MKTYEVELRRMSYVTVTVEAEDREGAETLAWLELEKHEHEDSYADWSLESIEEMEDDKENKAAC